MKNCFICSYRRNFILFLSLLFLPFWAEAQSNTVLPEQKKSEPIPDVPSFELTYKEEELKCYPNKLIRKKTHKNLIEFICMKKSVSVLLPDKEKLSTEDEKGRNKVKRLRQELEEKVNTGAIYKVQIPQNSAKHPWLARKTAKDILNKSYYVKYLRWLLPAKLYVSLRPQLAHSSDEGGFSFEDAGSRGGFFYYYSFDSGYHLTFQHESKVNLKGKHFVNLSESSDSYRRLSFLSLQKHDNTVIVGKYWSAYYDIAGFTDHFMAFGATGSGAFNNHGDGGASGTGRPDRMLQIHREKEKYSTTLQYQTSHSDDDKEYGYGVAGSFIYAGWEESKAGASVAYADFKKITELMRYRGIDGNDVSSILGYSYNKGKFMANAVLSYTQNHMNDDNGTYFDAVGTELYLRYDHSESIRLVGGINTLIPTDNDYEGEFNIKRLILSLQYTFGEKSFDDLVYMEVSLNGGSHADGTKSNTSVAIGFRYLLDFL